MTVHPQTPSSCSGSPTASSESCPSLDAARKEVLSQLGVRLCHWQYQVTAAVLQQMYVFASVATGMGKTLSFLAPVLFRPDGILVIVTPLNVLGSQMKELLEKVGISAISINAETATDENFEVISNELRLCTYLNYFRISARASLEWSSSARSKP